jgi:hypothetical protein
MHADASEANPCRDIETVEAEVVFLIRSKGQWPLFQTEIHFHESSEQHRMIAAAIIGHFYQCETQNSTTSAPG